MMVGGTCALMAGGFLEAPYGTATYVGGLVLWDAQIGAAIAEFAGLQTLSSVDNRNSFMVSSIVSIFNADHTIKQLAVVVGKAHLLGMYNLLETQGATAIDIDKEP